MQVVQLFGHGSYKLRLLSVTTTESEYMPLSTTALQEVIIPFVNLMKEIKQMSAKDVVTIPEIKN